MAAQACVCAAVGAGKLPSNHVTTAGWNNEDELIYWNTSGTLPARVFRMGHTQT